ncbi:MAG: shikimate kinase AroK [Gammaproteobacteria bacterium]|nr:shikimate kinase AroK [Gammaproteobacteria bacterium]
MIRRRKALPPTFADNLFLIGPMGAGKSTIGRRLAQTLKRPFIDSDHEIVARTGADIPLIFELEGEEGFRRRETAMIDELTARQGIVLATGGGAILAEENRRHLRERGLTIYLRTSIDQQLKRTAHDKNRPLLQTDNPRARLQALFEVRDPLYTETADLILETDGKPVPQVVDRVLRELSDFLERRS